jgi:protein-ribulosamine 3-kinase
MMEGEFHSMTALYNSLPTFFPEPYAWGQFSQNIGRPTYFFLCNFIDMSNDTPDPVQLCSKIAELHKRSVSPTGQFGFHITTCQGNLPQATGLWDPSWESFFRKMLTNAMDLNKQINGPWKDLEEVTERVKTHVLPKLLGPLESKGRSVKPCLIHGDLWDGNVGTDYETGEIYLFDAGAYYAHNEMEVAMWRGEVNKILRSKIYLKQYLSNIGVSEPVEQFDDRNRLYNSYMTLHASACHNGSFFRER